MAWHVCPELIMCCGAQYIRQEESAHTSLRSMTGEESTCLIHHNGQGLSASLKRSKAPTNNSCRCAPIINHTGPVRRIRRRGIGRPRGVWFLRPLPTSDHRLHLSLDDKNSRLIADENYLLRRHNGKSTGRPVGISRGYRFSPCSMLLPVAQT